MLLGAGNCYSTGSRAREGPGHGDVRHFFAGGINGGITMAISSMVFALASLHHERHEQERTATECYMNVINQWPMIKT